MWTIFVNKILELAKDIKYFFLDNSRNPFLWVGIILFVLIIFELVYNVLKDKN